MRPATDAPPRARRPSPSSTSSRNVSSRRLRAGKRRRGPYPPGLCGRANGGRRRPRPPSGRRGPTRRSRACHAPTRPTRARTCSRLGPAGMPDEPRLTRLSADVAIGHVSSNRTSSTTWPRPSSRTTDRTPKNFSASPIQSAKPVARHPCQRRRRQTGSAEPANAAPYRAYAQSSAAIMPSSSPTTAGATARRTPSEPDTRNVFSLSGQPVSSSNASTLTVPPPLRFRPQAVRPPIRRRGRSWTRTCPRPRLYPEVQGRLFRFHRRRYHSSEFDGCR